MKLTITPTGFDIFINDRLSGTVFPKDNEVIVDDVMSVQELEIFCSSVKTVMDTDYSVTVDTEVKE